MSTVPATTSTPPPTQPHGMTCTVDRVALGEMPVQEVEDCKSCSALYYGKKGEA